MLVITNYLKRCLRLSTKNTWFKDIGFLDIYLIIQQFVIDVVDERQKNRQEEYRHFGKCRFLYKTMILVTKDVEDNELILCLNSFKNWLR